MADWRVIAKCLAFAEHGIRVANGEVQSDHMHCADRLMFIAEALRDLLPPGFPIIPLEELPAAMQRALRPHTPRTAHE